ncbi:MAG: hypothetical protein HFJ09_07395 [Lachnospiraceae bacterium]|nr:hypothetical protein [Lachnospiraceae bacterium]
MLIDVYKGEVYEKLISYLQTKLPFEIFEQIKTEINSVYIDIDENKTIEPFMEQCNKILKDTNSICIQRFDDTYCAGVYFIEAVRKE